MVREMKKRGCKEVGGIPWDKMIVKEGIVLCKRTGELVGFEHLTINSELNMGPNNLQNEDGENTLNQVILTLLALLILILTLMKCFQMKNLQIHLKKPHLFASFFIHQ